MLGCAEPRVVKGCQVAVIPPGPPHPQRRGPKAEIGAGRLEEVPDSSRREALMSCVVLGSGGTLSLKLLRAPGSYTTCTRRASGLDLPLLPGWQSLLLGAWTQEPALPGVQIPAPPTVSSPRAHVPSVPVFGAGSDMTWLVGYRGSRIEVLEL